MAPSPRRKARRAGRKGAPGRAAPPAAIRELVERYRAGDPAATVEAAAAFTERWPGTADGWKVLALGREALGEPEAALEAWRRALKIEPDHPESHNSLGNLQRRLGRVEAAEKSFRRALRLRPEYLEAELNLGLVLQERGRLDEAEALYRALLARRPDSAAAHVGLGNVLHAAGRPRDAEAGYRRALEAAPGDVGIHANLGNVLADLDRLDEAEASYRRVLAVRPDHAGVLASLGLLLLRRGRPDAAEASCRRAIEAAPRATVGHYNLGRVLAARGRLTEAAAAWRRALEIDPGLAPAHHELGNVLMDLGELDAAEAAHRRAAELQPGSARAQRNLGVALASMGQGEAALAAWRAARDLDPDDGDVHYQIAMAHRFAAGDADLAALEGALARAGSGPARERAFLHFAAGKAHADLGEPERAFAHHAEANRLRRSAFDYDVGADEAWMGAIAEAFDGERLAALRAHGDATPAPVFIVGMWRSGTTLVEQLLASHPAVHGAGERSDLELAIEAVDAELGERFPAWVEGLAGERVGALGASLRATLVDTAPAAARVTEKTPEHFLYLGLLAAALPNARIIHVRRNPLDTCWSCYTRSFAAKLPFAYDLAELGRYYRAYAGLMDHWRAVLPAGMMAEVDYEALVADPEGEGRRLVAHVGLDWDPACVDFHRTRRAVSTASVSQVRQPLYRAAIDRWRPYRAHLGPLLDALGPLAPAIGRE